MSQNMQILKYLKDGNKLTPLEAMTMFGSMRLAARIWDIELMGYKVLSERIQRGRTHFARYSLIKNKNGDGWL